MQVPAEAVAEKSSTKVATHSPAGLFAALKDTAAGKTGLLPSFAQIFAENSIGVAASLPVSENVADLDGTAVNSTEPAQGSSVLRELRHSSPSGELFNEMTSVVEMRVGGDQGAFKATKSESKFMGHRRVNRAHSSNTAEKKMHFVSSQTEPSTSAVLFPVVAPPIQPATAPALKARASMELKLPAAFSVSKQTISIAQVQKDERSSDQGLGQDSRPALPGESFLSVDDALTSAVQHSNITAHVPAELQSSTTSGVLPEASWLVSNHANESRTSPIHTLETEKGESIRGAIETSEQRADAGEIATIISKLKKTPDQASETQAGGTSLYTRSPLMEMVRVSDNTPPVSVVFRGTEAVTNPAKQEQAQLDTNAFLYLDSGQAPPTMLLHGSSHQIAVGIHDPSLGWLEVQTQSSAGHINATLTAATAEAHTHLAAQAPAITQYLADRQIFVHSLNVHTQSDAQSGTSSDGQPHTGSDNTRQQTSGRGDIMEANSVKTQSRVVEVSTERTGDASYISVRV